MCNPNGKQNPNQVLKPVLGAFKLVMGSLMPEMGPLILYIGHLRPVYDPLRFKALGWVLYQTWNVPCVTRIRLLHEFIPSGMKGPFLCLKEGFTNSKI